MRGVLIQENDISESARAEIHPGSYFNLDYVHIFSRPHSRCVNRYPEWLRKVTSNFMAFAFIELT